MNKIFELMKSHVSVRSFLPEPIADTTLHALIEAGQSASTSSHIQAYSVIRVVDPIKRQTISEAAGGQRWVVEAPEFLVICADLNRLNSACLNSNMGSLEGLTEHSLAASIDAALFAQNVLLAAESIGLGGVFIGGIRNAPDTVIKTLSLPKLVFPLFGLCLGYPKEKNKTKPRLPVEAILHMDAYDANASERLPAYDAEMASYYQLRDAQSKVNWSYSVAAALQKKQRKHMRECLQKAGFFKS